MANYYFHSCELITSQNLYCIAFTHLKMYFIYSVIYIRRNFEKFLCEADILKISQQHQTWLIIFNTPINLQSNKQKTLKVFSLLRCLKLTSHLSASVLNK